MGPIFNKSRVKKEVCGSCKLCIGPTGKPPQPQEVRNALPKKKKKKTQTWEKPYPNGYLVSLGNLQHFDFSLLDSLSRNE